MNTVQLVSLAGAMTILAAFVLQQFGRWKASEPAYLLTNMIGAAVLTAVAWLESQWGFLLMEVVWTLVSAWGLYRLRTSPA